MTARYTGRAKVIEALRAPVGNTAATSWASGDFDDLLDDCIEKAEHDIDELCGDWASFDGGTTVEERAYLAGPEAKFGILSTDPYAERPTQIRIGDALITDLSFEPYHPIGANRSGKDMEATAHSKRPFKEGIVYKISARWGYIKIPSGIVLAATRTAARYFEEMRSALGIMEVPGGQMYMPRYDPAVTKWLRPYYGGDIA